MEGSICELWAKKELLTLKYSDMKKVLKWLKQAIQLDGVLHFLACAALVFTFYPIVNSLKLAFLVTAIDMTLGILVGALWGYSKICDKIFTELYNKSNDVSME